ncbi:cytochrome c biogenesis protein DipZ, partial [Salmonella enterica]|nr:cytochrome c biogenesis protein DipZ [Salmonella enterica]
LGIGGRVLAAMKRSMGATEWLRRVLGLAVLGGVLAIGTGADTGLLARLSTNGPAWLEQVLVDAVGLPAGAH